MILDTQPIDTAFWHDPLYGEVQKTQGPPPFSAHTIPNDYYEEQENK